MKSPGVFIRADAGTAIGYGHLVRCISLAHMVKVNFAPTFYIHDPSPDVIAILDNNRFAYRITNTDEDLFRDLSPESILVVDGYSFGESFDQRARETGAAVVTIDDLADRLYSSDVIINHAPGVAASAYRTAGTSQILLGPDYALLRPLFLGQAAKERSPGKTGEVMICFGGSDKMNLTLSTLSRVIDSRGFKSVNLVVGGGYLFADELSSFTGGHQNIKLTRNADEATMLNAFLNADLAIVPSSGVLFEAIACKTPVISGYYVDNQQSIYQGFKSANAFYDAEGFSTHAIDAALKMAMQSDPLEMTKRHSRLIDGASGERIRSVFNKLGRS